MKWLMSVYASYILPLAIIGVPMLWKRLYDTSPDSMMKVAVLERDVGADQTHSWPVVRNLALVPALTGEQGPARAGDSEATRQPARFAERGDCLCDWPNAAAVAGDRRDRRR